MTPEAQDLIEAQITALRSLAARLDAETERLRVENVYLRRENETLWESIQERDERIAAMVARGAA